MYFELSYTSFYKHMSLNFEVVVRMIGELLMRGVK